MSSPASILGAIAARRRQRVAASGPAPLPPPRAAIFGPGENDFLGALVGARQSRGGAIIAEVKMGSPRLEPLAGRVDPEAQARLYAEHGATALSVVVEPDYFAGSPALLTACRAASGLPALAKDFVIDPLQLSWAAEAGASAALLIAALLSASELVHYAGLARGFGMVPLIEVHDPEDIAKLGDAEWELVGINNRDLTTFTVDLERSLALRHTLPPGTLAIAESGIRDGRDATRLIGGGFDGLLIGESLLLSPDPARQLRDFIASIAPASQHAAR